MFQDRVPRSSKMHNFPIYLLYFISFVDLFAVGLVIPLVGNHVRELGASHVFVGLMGSLYSGCQLASSPLIGSWSDLKGRRGTLLLTLLVCGAAYLLLGCTTSVLLLLTLRVVLGIFKQTQMLTKALVPDHERNELRQAAIYGKMAAISGGGFVLGPIIGGHIMEDFAHNGFQVNATLSSLLFILNAALVWFLQSPEEKKTEAPPQPAAARRTSVFSQMSISFNQSVREILKIDWAIYWDAFLFKALVGFCMGVYYSSYSMMLKSQFGLTPKHIGYTISFQGVVGSVCSYFIADINSRYAADGDYTQRNMHCFILMTASLVGMVLSWNLWTFVPWLVPLAVSNAVGRLVTLEMILKKSEGKHRGTLIGASNSVRSLAGVLAPTLAGVISDYYGVTYVLYVATACALVGLALSINIRSQSKVQKLE